MEHHYSTVSYGSAEEELKVLEPEFREGWNSDPTLSLPSQDKVLRQPNVPYFVHSPWEILP